MSRFFKKITVSEFKKLMKPLIEGFHLNIDDMEDDLKKVDFSTENVEFLEQKHGLMNYPCGLKQLSNGMPCWFVNAGGDWETPICFVIYYDGKKLRAYIPRAGNMWNRDKKCAFGSDDYESETDRHKMIVKTIKEVEEWDPDLAEEMKADLERQCDENDSLEYFFMEDFDFSNHDAILKDVQNRILEKV